MILADGASFIGVQRRIGQFLTGLLNHLDGVGELEVIPKDGRRVQVAFGLAGLNGGHLNPRRGRAVVTFAIGLNLADAGEHFAAARVGLG